MRLLLTSDLHYKLRQYDWLIGMAARFDVVVVAGDHIDAFLPVPSEVQIAALSATLTAVARQSRLLVCSGNHDLNARNVEGEKTADWLDALLAELVARHSPTAVLCGHIHEAPFKSGGSWIDRVGDTWLCNAGGQIGEVPARVEIDFARHTARWISLAGTDERSLQ